MNALLIGWRASRVLPVGVVRAAAATIAAYAWATKAAPVRRLEQNLHKVTGAEGRELRRLSRRGMASAARYYAEVLELGSISGEAIDARARMVNFDGVKSALDHEAGTVAVLSHCGNWDLIGAYACRNIIHVTAVAEVLRPREVFEQFVKLREGLGMSILGHEGSATFRKLISVARSEHTLVCLLADRDMSGSGVEVQMWGQGVRVAPGPAALAIAAKTAVVPVMIYSERLRGQQRRRARSRWGVVLEFGPVLKPEDFPEENRLEAMTQAWASFFEEQIAAHPEDWHMLQRFGWVA